MIELQFEVGVLRSRFALAQCYFFCKATLWLTEYVCGRKSIYTVLKCNNGDEAENNVKISTVKPKHAA